MKIAFVVGKFPLISETPILNQVTGLIDLGHEVDIFSFARGDNEVMHPDVQKYGLLAKAVYLDPLFAVSEGVREVRLALDEKLSRNMGAKLLSPLNLFRFARDAVSLLLLYRSSLLDGKGPYDVIHCQMGTVGLKFLPFHRLRILGGKLIVQFRGEDITEFVKQRGDRVFLKLFRYGDYFLPVCDYLRNRAVKLGCPEDKISIMKSAIDCKRFVFLERRKPESGPTRIVFVGRLVEKKGVEYAIQAIEILKNRGYQAKLLIVGDGPLKQNLRNLCRDLAIENHVEFLGAKNHDEIVEILNTAHLFTAPSVTSRTSDQEGIPNVLKEAMAMGLPVVSTYHGGIPELVKDGISGFLVAERDFHALADRLGYLIDHPEKWLEMGRAGRQFVEKNYDKKKLNQQLVDIYHHVVGL
jgi:colanic acid/amylovoran biosynthesis glycosyltransferase